MGYTMETMREVWNDQSGERVEIGPDRDALGLVELRTRDGDGNLKQRLTFAQEEARMVALAMLACLEDDRVESLVDPDLDVGT